MDPFASYTFSPGSIATNAAEVFADDNADLAVLPVAFILPNGDPNAPALSLRMTLTGGTTITLPITPDVPYPFRVQRFHVTGSDAAFTGATPQRIVTLW